MFGFLKRSKLQQFSSAPTQYKHRTKQRLSHLLQWKRFYCGAKYRQLGNLYARLGLTGAATQDEIKNAYYELSKQHHPDKNEGSDEAAKQFRSITEAYEILGNTTTRARYDKETPYAKVVYRPPKQTQPRPSYHPSSAFTEKDEDFEAKIRFYRENMRQKAKKPQEKSSFSRPPVFDFDAWYRAHFFDDFDRKWKSERFDFEEFDEEAEKAQTQKKSQEKADLKMRYKYGFRPPKPFKDRPPPSDIEIQMELLHEKQKVDNVLNVLAFSSMILAVFLMCAYIIEKNNPMSNRPPPPPDES